MELIKDEALWKIAQKRASFKNQLVSYVIINSFLWAIWYITAGRQEGIREFYLAWPIWSTLGWGIGLAFSYFGAYHELGTRSAVEKEYQKLLDERK